MTANYGPVHVSVHMIGDQRHVEKKRAPLASKKIKNVVGGMDGILGENQRVQIVALVYRVFVIGFEFIESDDVPDSEKDEEGGEDEGDDIAKSGESERHLQSMAGIGGKWSPTRLSTMTAVSRCLNKYNC